ncbi:TonB-dependent receptor [Elizabethkingia occulta]|uniref:TonB-dependent receptor n=1 Tax=Elizabethkingia occulta TaxID=1867263 RepID=A0A1T3MGC6_9FLAO|nr:TonB-dependent receptor [Elizabethkingia occulta]OPB93991.1 TonB-dependent receptor [Elizabethkingia occulta]OPC63718.1 TonB-dependent receptor [Elizabethkingia occulta]
MKINFRKPILAAVLSTASVYYAQQTKDTLDSSKNIQEVVLRGVTDVAKDRKTPVAVSTVKAAQIVERLGNQEFPEILKTTPSVYATRGGGGLGDGRLNIRGFDTKNTAVMVNGMPVNDMEGGTVYWSNWQGLSDVTSFMQIQRGLGSSKLAIASVGGTVNILTKSSDMKEGGNVSVGLGNNGYMKTMFSYNTGRSAKGWSSSFLMGRTYTNGYIDGGKGEAYNYYFALGYKPNQKHDFQFTFTGAPQWHNQNFYSSIATLQKYGKDGNPNRRYNPNWGYLNGQEFSTNTNWYTKPVAMLNWDWTMNSKSKLSTVLYGSWGRGGGTATLGNINGNNTNYSDKSPLRDADGILRWDDIVRWNQGGRVADFGANKTATNGEIGLNTSNIGITKRASVNSHNWYGFRTDFQHKINDNWNFSVGLDGRYYYGYHPGYVTDFLGASGYLEKGDLNYPNGYIVRDSFKPVPSANPFAKATKDNTQYVYRNYNGEVLWGGFFGQLEYSSEKFSAFVQASASEQGFQRIDNWVVDGVTVKNKQIQNTKTGFKYIFGYNAKGGVNYNVDENHNIFANIGYYSKQPNNYGVYPSNNQNINPNLTNEKIFSGELGYGYRSSKLNMNVNLYYTSWKDRFQRFTNLPNLTDINGNKVQQPYANMDGIQEIHMGVEFEGTYKINEYISINGMFSIGDWYYKGNASGEIFDINDQPVQLAAGQESRRTFALDKVKVSDAAQTTASLGVTLRPVKALSVYGTWTYADRYYGGVSFNQDYLVGPNGEVTEAAKKGALKYPSFSLFDVGTSYNLKLNEKQSFVFGVNVYNIFNKYYISDARTSTFAKQLSDFKDIQGGQSAQQQFDAYQKTLYRGIDPSNQVYFGAGTTWSASIAFKF